MAEALGTVSRPLRVAIVGSGPAGFYAAGALGKSELEVHVDLLDALPVPYGLVRSGVAPDHAKIKSVTKQYVKIAESDYCSFYGNIRVGTDVSIEELKTFYDAIILAHGAESDRSLGIPGEDLPGSRTATEFVGWYNCHPSFKNSEFDLDVKKVAIIGQGNVAVDVARILAKPVEDLRSTDIAQHSLDALAKSQVEEIHMIGRRGPVQGAFTDKELKELGEIPNCDVIVQKQDLELSPEELEELEQSEKVRRNNYKILKEFSEKPLTNAKRKLFISFFRSPIKVLGSERVEGLELEINELVGEAGARKSRGTGQTERLDCDLVFRSVGYRGVGLSGVPFDQRSGTYENEKGRILNDGVPEPGMYTAGWIKRGPSGVIGTNKADSVETVRCLLEDIAELAHCEQPDTNALLELLEQRAIRVISYEDWLRIDQLEVALGQERGKEREKFISIEDVVAALASG
jgi:ferredoxin--NADP+ reductase